MGVVLAGITTVIHVDTQLIAILAGIVIPLLTGLVTKLRAGSAVKAVTTAVLAVLAGAVTSLVVEPEKGIALYDFFYATALAFISSIATYYGFWKPTGVTNEVQTATADVGIGKPKEPTTLPRP